MVIKEYCELFSFPFWGNAVSVAEKLTYKEMEVIESFLGEAYYDGIGKTELNDIFSFEEDYIAQILGYDSWEELEEERE